MGADDDVAAGFSYLVTVADTASAMGSGDVDVLATPRVLALVERATVQALRGRLPDGRTSVGIRVELEHTRPTRAGETVQVRATSAGIDGGRCSFAVEVTEADGSVAASGTVVRAVVDRARFA
jgi:fluoroacetyl-CoA thioesterase